MGNEITGIASEFYVLSMLLRKGADATLTLGNKKNIDIFVNKDWKAFTIDVKVLKSTGDFILGNHEETFHHTLHFPDADRHRLPARRYLGGTP